MNEHDSDKLQLRDNERQSASRKRHHKKLEAVNWARKFSIHSAAMKFDVQWVRIKGWMKNEEMLERQV